MRAKSQWTPGGIALWLIAAILATLVVCSQAGREPKPPVPEGEIEFEVEVAE